MQSGYLQAGKWQAGWTSRTAHLVVGMARSHGNARYMKVTGKCGQSFNPGRVVDPQNVNEGFALCGKCQPPKVEAVPLSESPKLLTPAEQATLLDIVRQYHAGTAAPQNAMAWVYGLVANSALNDGSL